MTSNFREKEVFKPFEIEDDGFLEFGVSSEKTIEMLRTKIKGLNSDISVLKRLVYMLNVELELRDSGQRENENKQNLMNSNLTDGILLKADIKMIEPLLQAFEQTKREKDELLADYRQSFDELANRCKHTVLENDALRQELHESKIKVESTLSEWQKLHEKFLLVEEHNQLLIRQSKLFQSRIRNVEAVYQQTLKQLDDEKKELVEKYEITKTELLFLKGKHNAYCDQKNSSVIQSNQQFDANLSTFTLELKNISNEIKLQHANEVRILRSQIKNLESEKCGLDIKLASVTSERDHLEGYVSAIERETRKMNLEFENMKEELKLIRDSEGEAKKQIIKCMMFIRELVSVHNSTFQSKEKTENTT